MGQDQLFILWVPKGKVAYVMRLFTPETFFNTMKYMPGRSTAYIVRADISEEPSRLTTRTIRETFPQFMDTAYAQAAIKERRK